MDFYIAEIPFHYVAALGVAAAIAGFWRGGRDGAVVGSLVVAQVGLALVIEAALPAWLGFTEDIVTLTACLYLALTGRRYWTIVASATQVLSLVTQLLRVTTDLTTWAYYSAQTTWFLMLIASLFVGSLLTPRARKSPVGA